jgi:hypothetical protein
MQEFAEKLFKKLEGLTEKFEVKVMLLELVSRLIGTVKQQVIKCRKLWRLISGLIFRNPSAVPAQLLSLHCSLSCSSSARGTVTLVLDILGIVSRNYQTRGLYFGPKTIFIPPPPPS